MKSTFTCANPDSINFTATITMSLKEWREIREHLDKEYFGPVGQLRSEIQDLVYQAEKIYYPENKE